METNQHRAGVIFGIAAFVLWGGLPIFWKLLADIPPSVITAHRIIWSSVTLFLIILLRGRLPQLKEKLVQPRILLCSCFTGLLLYVNWLIYVWGTNNDRVVEVSLGYYILPLLMIVLGYFLLHEELNRLQIIAVSIATLGVVLQGLGIGSLPWPALGVACSFAIYSVIKKRVQSDGFTSLIIETGAITPFAIAYLCFQSSDVSVWGDARPITVALLLLTGLATIAPLICFVEAANRIPLTTIGMLQFVAPTGQFLLGVFYFHEGLNPTQLVSFSLIWIAVSIYVWSKLRLKRANVG